MIDLSLHAQVLLSYLKLVNFQIISHLLILVLQDFGMKHMYTIIVQVPIPESLEMCLCVSLCKHQEILC